MSFDAESFAKEVDQVLNQIEAEQPKEETTESKDSIVDEKTPVEVDKEIENVSKDDPSEVHDKEDKEEFKGDPALDPSAKRAVEWDENVLARALSAGMSLSDARSFPDSESLGKFVSRVEENLLVRSEVSDDNFTQTEGEEDLFAGLPKLDPEVYEPEVVQAFDKLTDIIRKQEVKIAELGQRSRETAIGVQDANVREVSSWFDKKVESLGDDFKDSLGVGEYSSLNRNSKQFSNREAIAKQMAIMLSGYNASGINAPPRDELFDSASMIVLRNDFQRIGERKLSGDLEKQASQHIQRARGTSHKSVASPEDEIAAMLDEKFFKR